MFRLNGLMIPSLNSTIGHTDGMLGIGLDITRTLKKIDPDNCTVSHHDVASTSPLHDVEEDADDSAHYISTHEMKEALDNALRIAAQSDEEIQQDGWTVVHAGEDFSLYKRRAKTVVAVIDKSNQNQSDPVQYLMLGHFRDVSPQTFLFSQLDRACRSLWDTTMHTMSDSKLNIHELPPTPTGRIKDAVVNNLTEKGNEQEGIPTKQEEQQQVLTPTEEDVLYYRTRWPWPLKDRDYCLSRRCKLFPKKNSIMLVSKSIEDGHHPPQDKVIRVDNYWCYSAFISTRKLLSVATAPTPTASTGSKLTCSPSPEVELEEPPAEAAEPPEPPVVGQEVVEGTEEDLPSADVGTTPDNSMPAAAAAAAAVLRTNPRAPVYKRRRLDVLIPFRNRGSRNRKKAENAIPPYLEPPTSSIPLLFSNQSLEVAFAGETSHSSITYDDDDDDDESAEMPYSPLLVLPRDLFRRYPRVYPQFASVQERNRPKYIIKQKMLSRVLAQRWKQEKQERDRAMVAAAKQMLRRSPFFQHTFGSTIASCSNVHDAVYGYNGTAAEHGIEDRSGNPNHHQEEEEEEEGAYREGAGETGANSGSSYSLPSHSIKKERMARHHAVSDGQNVHNIYKPGMRFVTIFCDDQKVPLPATVVDVLSKQGEKVVPASVSKLHVIARNLEETGEASTDADD